MKKSFIFLLIVDIILIISLICLYNYVIQANKGNLEAIFSAFRGNSEVCSRVSDLEDKVEALEEKIETLNNQ